MSFMNEPIVGSKQMELALKMATFPKIPTMLVGIPIMHIYELHYFFIDSIMDPNLAILAHNSSNNEYVNIRF